jgi:hypothetical protein
MLLLVACLQLVSNAEEMQRHDQILFSTDRPRVVNGTTVAGIQVRQCYILGCRSSRHIIQFFYTTYYDCFALNWNPARSLQFGSLLLRCQVAAQSENSGQALNNVCTHSASSTNSAQSAIAVFISCLYVHIKPVPITQLSL